MGNNFVPAVLVIGGMGLALHYEELALQYDGAPLVMAYGLPVSGKSLAVQIAMALTGDQTSIGECTQAGILKLASSRTLPFWWDDVSDVNALETLAVQAYNQSQRQTAKIEKACYPRAIPIMTMNPQCIYRKGKVEKEKISRVFSRIATIPFNKISGIQTLQGSLLLKASLQPLLSKAVLSVGTLLELRSDFQTMQEDKLFKEICEILENSQLDMRSQLNYALLLFSTAKILEKLGLNEYFNLVKTYFVETILPSVCQLLDAGDSGSTQGIYSVEEQNEFTSFIERIVVQCTAAPHEVKSFFLPKASIKSKCKCGDVFGFKVSEAMRFVGYPEREQALRMFVTSTKRGCVGRLTFPGVGQCGGCIHIQRVQLPQDLLKKMDEAFLTKRSNVPRPCANDKIQGVNAVVAQLTQTNSEECAIGGHEVVEMGDAGQQAIEDNDVILVGEQSPQGADYQSTTYAGSDVIHIGEQSTQGVDHQSSTNKGTETVTTKPKRNKKRGADVLMDNLHPGEMEGKRTCSRKGQE